MREHLYRGKRKDNGEWIYGDLRHISDWKDSYNLHIVDNTNGRNNDVTGLEIIPETCCEFTGLTDKNGVKIFEGDIMKFSAYGKEYIGIVEIVDGNAGVTCGEGGIKASPFLDTAVSWYGATIIGNIFDNPELMGGEKNVHRS